MLHQKALNSATNALMMFFTGKMMDRSLRLSMYNCHRKKYVSGGLLKGDSPLQRWS
jgi:hypothetical protein